MTASDDPKVLAAQAAASAAIAADAADTANNAAAATKLAIDGLAAEVRLLRKTLNTHPTHGQVRRARWISIVVVLAILAASIAVVRFESRNALLAACYERQELEAVLRGILTEASEHREVNEDATEAAHDRRFAKAAIKALTSPPCRDQVETDVDEITNPSPAPSPAIPSSP